MPLTLFFSSIILALVNAIRWDGTMNLVWIILFTRIVAMKVIPKYEEACIPASFSTNIPKNVKLDMCIMRNVAFDM